MKPITVQELVTLSKQSVNQGREREREDILVLLRSVVDMPPDERPGLYELIETIERGEHVR